MRINTARHVINSVGNDAMMNIIRPDMINYAKKLKTIRNLFFIGIFVAFIAFPITGFAVMQLLGEKYIPIVFIPFLCFPLCGVLTGIFSNKYLAAKKVISLMEQIEYSDALPIYRLLSAFDSENMIVTIAKKLIATGNLTDYSFQYNDRLIVRNGAIYNEKEYIDEINIYDNKMQQQMNMNTTAQSSNSSLNSQTQGFSIHNDSYYYNTSINFCDNCGAKLDTDSNFCPNCGAKIDR